MTPLSIVTLTMNPAVDIATDVERLEPVHKLRCGSGRRDPGGGGINVARAITRLKGNATALYTSGGATGLVLDSLLKADRFPLQAIPIAGETRIDFSVREISTGAQYRFVLPGPLLSPSEIQSCLETLIEMIGEKTMVVASGSLPPGVPTDFYARAARVVAARNARFILDTSGEPLARALGSGLHVMKPSRRELEALVGYALPDHAACAEACRRIIRESGAEMVALSLGEEGAMLVGRDVALAAPAPHVRTVSSIGAGDSFLGGLVFEMARHSSPENALRTAIAAGSAALLAEGTGLCDFEDVERLRPLIEVRAAV